MSMRKTVMLFFLAPALSFEPLLRKHRNGVEPEALGDVGSNCESAGEEVGTVMERLDSTSSAGAGERTTAPMIRRREREETRLREEIGRVGDAASGSSSCTRGAVGACAASTVAQVSAGSYTIGGPASTACPSEASSPGRTLALSRTLWITWEMYSVAKHIVTSPLWSWTMSCSSSSTTWHCSSSSTTCGTIVSTSSSSSSSSPKTSTSSTSPMLQVESSDSAVSNFIAVKLYSLSAASVFTSSLKHIRSTPHMFTLIVKSSPRAERQISTSKGERSASRPLGCLGEAPSSKKGSRSSSSRSESIFALAGLVLGEMWNRLSSAGSLATSDIDSGSGCCGSATAGASGSHAGAGPAAGREAARGRLWDLRPVLWPRR
mmetsp:Transcript_101347/g.295208  ORF Transcript_101347/g.295208 Transcript_101347/m.295208 type:complete len:376 (-) Transcript_101347:89-1216(-)